MTKHRLWRVMFAASGVIALLIPQGAAAAVATGHVYQVSSGLFEWCDPDSCTYWYSSSEGWTEWTTTQYHSEGQTYFVVAPFQQDEDLFGGQELHSDGIYPSASYYSKISYPNGSVLYSTYHATYGSDCWPSAISPSDIYWPACSTGGFTMYWSSRPPGATESHYLITAAAVTGSFSGVYRGNLN